MYRYILYHLIAAIFVLSVTAIVNADDAELIEEFTTVVTREPAEARFVADDVVNFIRVQKMLAGQADTLGILQTEYLDKGTVGLQMFIQKYDLTAERLLKAMRKRPEKYSSLDEFPEAIAALGEEARPAFAKLKEYIPQTVYPPTYFLVSGYRGIGSGSIEGSLISVEKWSTPIEGETTMLLHELTHFQQGVAIGYAKYKALFGPEKSLLGLCIREGTAEFFANLTTGTITQDEAVEFLQTHERRLWLQFAKEMDGRETGDWMWSTPADSTQPPHVGYVLGMRIVESYYNNAEDKAQAVREILAVTDYRTFLRMSGYDSKFAE